MKAWRIYDYGKMQLDEIPEPKTKEGWVVIKVKIVQPAITETLLFKGFPTHHYDLIKKKLAEGPAQLFGHEFSAEIVDLGPGVKEFAIGDRVTSKALSACGDCYLCRSGKEDLCQKGPTVGFHIPGCLAEFAAVPASTLVKLPEGVSDSEGAAIQPLTDAVAAVKAASIEMGDLVVVLGLGSMGLPCMQTARVSGAGIVIAVDIKDQSCELAKKLGADIVINAKHKDPVEYVLEFTKGRGADIVFEAAGGPEDQGLAGTNSFLQATQMVKDSGKIIGVALYGDHTKLSYEIFRSSGKQYLLPVVLSYTLLKHTVDLVASKRVNLGSLITHILDGIEKVPEAFEITENKSKFNLLNPAQVIISK